MDEFTEDRNSSPREDPPVTAVASRRVKPGREREFEEWVSGIRAAVKKFPGYIGSEPARAGPTATGGLGRRITRSTPASTRGAGVRTMSSPSSSGSVNAMPPAAEGGCLSSRVG